MGVELLSPAGNMEGLYAAVNNGCDSVYIGGRNFSARQYAGNFSDKEMKEAIDYCHLRGVKVHVAVNTLYKNEEIKSIMSFVEKVYKMGADALILQDMGVFELIKRNFPDIPLHASTQLTAMNLEDVNFLAEKGFSRVILSRELSIDEISYIAQNAKCETEVFIHGALCYSFSGQCLMSSMIGGRSGNRGRCAQPCRLPYTLYKGYDRLTTGYLLSPKDIQTVNLIPMLIESGVTSLKIEGRMKTPQYIAGVTSIYRKYIENYEKSAENAEVSKEDIKILSQLFNRGGFTEGYMKHFSGSDMVSVERPKSWGVLAGHVDKYVPSAKKVTIRTREDFIPGDGIEIWTSSEPHPGCNITKQSKAGDIITITLEGDIEKNQPVYKTYDKKLNDSLSRTWEKDVRKLKVTGKAKILAGMEMSLELETEDGTRVKVKGEKVQKAEKAPMKEEDVKARLLKMGATSFEMDDIQVKLGENVYVPVSALNELRRRAAEALSEKILEKDRRELENPPERLQYRSEPAIRRKKINVLVTTCIQFEEVIEHEGINLIYIELTDELLENAEKYISMAKAKDILVFAALPQVNRAHTAEINESIFSKMEKLDFDGYLVRTMGEFSRFVKTGKKIAVDTSLNVFNKEDVSFWQSEGAEIVTLSTELNINDIKSVGNKSSEMIVYGYMPLMISQQCPVGNFAGERKIGMYCKYKDSKDEFYLKDRKGYKFPLLRNCRSCTVVITNGKPLFTLKFFGEILNTPTGHIRLSFTTENLLETRKIMRAYSEYALNGKALTKPTLDLIKEMSDNESTKGHFFRGVE